MSLEHFAMDPRLPVDEMVDLQELWESDSFESKHATGEPHSVEGWPYMNVGLIPDEMEDIELKSVIVLRDRLMTDAAYCPDLQAEFATFPPMNDNDQKHSSEEQSGDLHQTQHTIHTGHREMDIQPDNVVSLGCSHSPKDNKEQCHGTATLLPPIEIKSEPLSQPPSPQSESCPSTNMIHSLSTVSAKTMEVAFHPQSNNISAYSYASQLNPIFFPIVSGPTEQCARRNRCNLPIASESQSISSFVPKMNMSDHGSSALGFTPGLPHMSQTNHTQLKCNPLSIKMEAATRVAFLPPTPPSSHTSDCEGGLSPLRDREMQLTSLTTSSASSKGSLPSVMSPISDNSYHNRHHLLGSHKLGSGTLYLTEEEKRILMAEGYPIPIKYPLTKVEEKSLKKIRRKIKNKISAQESRRKKKEYLDALERRSDMLAAENIEFRRRVMELESSNLALQNQLRNLEESLKHSQNSEKNPSIAPSMATSSGAN